MSSDKKARTDSSLGDAAILSHLEALAQSLGIPVRYEALEGESMFYSGGLCRIRNKQVIILNTMSTSAERVRTLARALRHFDLTGVYIRPAIRNFLERFQEEETEESLK
jgi:hypothetical protein